MQVVFHLVGGSLPQSSNADPAADIYNSLLPTVRMLDACRAAGVSKVVFPSSGGTVYGCPRTVPIAETEPTDPIAAYGVSRLAIEKYLALYQRLHGLDYAILRIANPFGPGQLSRKGQGVIAALIKSALAGQTLEIWGDGEVVRDFVYVDDVIDSLMAVVPHAGPHRLFNVGHGVGRSINEVIADIEAMLGHGPLPRLYTPGRQADVPVNVLDIRLIQRELGWRPRTEWREALTRTADWVRKTGAVIE
jgi:UDP-glucose 4-epimerase